MHWWYHPTILSSVIPFSSCIFHSIRVFSNESALHIRWPKYRSFSFSIGPSNEYSGLISFRMNWLDLLAVKGTLKSLLQHHSSKASTLWCSAFFIVQLSHPYMTTGKTIALTRQTFVGKVMSLLLNTLDLSKHELGQTFMIFVSKNYPWSLPPEEKHSTADLLNCCKQLKLTWQLVLQSSLRKFIKIKDTIGEVTSSNPPS